MKKERDNANKKPGAPRQGGDWLKSLLPLFQKYRGKKHPLVCHNLYELIVVVILSSQSTDERINELAPAFFRRYPTVRDLATAKPENLYEFIRSVRSSRKKAHWLVGIARQVGGDERLPKTMDGLTSLPGIGRKSANVIIRESGGNAEGIIVDLHVLRVVPRIGITREKTPEKIERKLMGIIPQEYWNDAGMSFSFLGREICRPTDPQCPECLLNTVCAYYRKTRKRDSFQPGGRRR
jgi:endonuclease-3